MRCRAIWLIHNPFASGATDYAPMRIAFTRIPDPELEEIDRSLNRRLRPIKGSPPDASADE